MHPDKRAIHVYIVYIVGDGPRAFTYARRSTYGTSIDVRIATIFHGLMAVIKANFLVDKGSIT